MELQNLEAEELVSRLRRLVGSERNVQVDFLLHLAEFDHRRQFLDEGCASLWGYCDEKLGFRDGAIFLRITAARLLRRFPFGADYLRDGRLSMTSLADLREVLTEENAARLFEEASGQSSDGVKRIARAILPIDPRKSGIRKLPPPRIPEPIASRTPFPDATPMPTLTLTVTHTPTSDSTCEKPVPVDADLASPVSSIGANGESEFVLVPSPVPLPRRVKVEPVSATQSQIVMVVDLEFLARLKKAQSILSHTIPTGDPAAIFSKGIDLILAKHAKRVGPPMRARRRAPVSAPEFDARSTSAQATALAGPPASADTIAGAVIESKLGHREPDPSQSGGDVLGACGDVSPSAKRDAKAFSKPVSFLRKAIPAAVFRTVWARDGGGCQWPTGKGHVCGSDFQPQGDHVIPVAWGGRSTVENLRILCRIHNIEHARQFFGAVWMDRFRRTRTSAGRSGDVDSGGSRVSESASDVFPTPEIAAEDSAATSPAAEKTHDRRSSADE